MKRCAFYFQKKKEEAEAASNLYFSLFHFCTKELPRFSLAARKAHIITVNFEIKSKISFSQDSEKIFGNDNSRWKNFSNYEFDLTDPIKDLISSLSTAKFGHSTKINCTYSTLDAPKAITKTAKYYKFEKL